MTARFGMQVGRAIERRRRRVGLAVAATALLAVIGSAQQSIAAQAPAPPFTQCPAVGLSPSCKILLVVDSTGVTVYENPAAGNYDGGDDTLVGIVNNSANAVPAVTVTGPGSGLAGFDGDGICTYLACTWPTTTGYEGPGSSFVTDPTSQDTAEVDFASGGLSPGASTYFSLEGTLTAATLTARKGGLATYAALGDSYSAGEMGIIGAYEPGTDTAANHCHRSTNAYGPILNRANNLGTLRFVACSGAVTADMFNDNHSGNMDPSSGTTEAAQLTALDASTKTVTLTIGGNDVGFTDIITECVIGRFGILPVHSGSPDPRGCAHDPKFTAPVYARLRALDGTGTATTSTGLSIHSLLSVIEEAHRRAPAATIYVGGYPRLFGAFQGECRVGTAWITNPRGTVIEQAAVKVRAADATWMNSLGNLMNQVVSDETALARREGINAVQVNPDGNFANHRLCDTGSPWLIPITAAIQVGTSGVGAPNVDVGSMHPTLEGQRAYAAAFQTALP